MRRLEALSIILLVCAAPETAAAPHVRSHLDDGGDFLVTMDDYEDYDFVETDKPETCRSQLRPLPVSGRWADGYLGDAATRR